MLVKQALGIYNIVITMIYTEKKAVARKFHDVD